MEDSYDVGVIVGRFQVPELHEAHMDIIRSVCEKHKKVIIFLGLSPLLVTTRNPLDFESRKRMILAEFPQVNVLYAKDCHSDEIWVRRLDEQIKDVVSPNQSVILYGGRDSFIKHYTPHGKFPTRELEQTRWISGTEMRKSISKTVRSSPDFRAGVIWAAWNQFPKTITTVDVAVFKDGKILLVRKPLEDKWRLIGGFSDPQSNTFEQDARREVDEETSVSITDPVYVGSFKIDDWRYRNEVDQIKSLLFMADYMYGAPRASDDVAEVGWFDFYNLAQDTIVPEHREMIEYLSQKVPHDKGIAVEASSFGA